MYGEIYKDIPLYTNTISTMLNKKLQADRWNKMCYQLLKLMTKQEKGLCSRFDLGKGVVRFGKWGKLNPRYVRPFKVLEKVRAIAYMLELPQELRRVHNTFHVSNVKKCYVDEPLAILLDGLHIDDKLHFVEEPFKIMDREVERLKRSRIPIIKNRWNSKEVLSTWEREDQFRKKYPHLFIKTAPSSSVAS
ncbi:hypothetical protein Tco_0228681 [Tanacetum coccineum]